MDIVECDANKRHALRQPVLKAAKILFGDAVIDCLVHDISATGARISMDAMVALPSEVTLELRSGGMWLAAVRWQRGNETGLEFTLFAGLHAVAAVEASRLYSRMRNSGVHDILTSLSDARHFDHPALLDATHRLEQAVEALEESLRVAAGRSTA